MNSRGCNLSHKVPFVFTHLIYFAQVPFVYSLYLLCLLFCIFRLKLICYPDEFVTSPTCPPEHPKCFCPIASGTTKILKSPIFSDLSRKYTRPLTFQNFCAGEEVLRQLGFDKGFTILDNVLCMIALFVGLHFLTCTAKCTRALTFQNFCAGMIALFVGFHVLAFFALRRVFVLSEAKRTKLQPLTNSPPSLVSNDGSAELYIQSGPKP